MPPVVTTYEPLTLSCSLDKYKKEAKEMGRESWWLSWAMDLTNEERRKGKTVEVGRYVARAFVHTPQHT